MDPESGSGCGSATLVQTSFFKKLKENCTAFVQCTGRLFYLKIFECGEWFAFVNASDYALTAKKLKKSPASGPKINKRQKRFLIFSVQGAR